MVINDLPPEVLGEIFESAASMVQMGRTIDEGYILRSSHRWAPLNFVHVCRYWREIALSMQTLWHSFELRDFEPDAATHWVGFARTCPLHLAYWPSDGMEWGKPVEERILKKSKEMLRRISLCADRWHSLDFCALNVEITEAMADMLEASAFRSPLKRFDIKIAHEGTPSKVIDALAFAISSFPSLRRLSWTFGSRQSSLPRVLPWHALEHIYVRGSIEVEDFMWCLTQCTSARNVTLLALRRENKQRVTDAFINVQCTLPTVESLTLNEYSDPYRLLQHFTLPSLVYLEILSVDRTSTALQDFFVRSQCPLQTFHLEVGQMKMEHVIGCLLTPYLKSVPNVFALLFVASEPYLADMVLWQPDLLRILPKLKAWEDRTGYNIGWKGRGEEIVRV